MCGDWSPEGRKGSAVSLTSLLTRNWQLKLASLALAVLLWVTMRISDGEVRSLEIPGVPVRVSQPTDEWRLRGEPSPATVDLIVTGSMGDLFRAARAEAELVIPVDSIDEEDMLLEVVPEWVWSVDQTSVVIDDIAPSTVRLIFERDRTDDIPVSLRLTGRLPDSLAFLAAPRSNLLFVQVRGPESEVDALETVFLRPLELSVMTASGSFPTEVDAAGLESLDIDPLQATVTVQVAPREVRQVGPVAVRHAALGPGLAVVPDSLLIEVSGAGPVLDQVDAAALTARISADPQALQRVLDELGEVRLPVEILGVAPFVDAVAVPDSVTVGRAPPS